jgi:hypothetical protein
VERVRELPRHVDDTHFAVFRRVDAAAIVGDGAGDDDLARDRAGVESRAEPPLQAYIAVMRKLLHAFYGMFTTNTDFVAENFYALASHTP